MQLLTLGHRRAPFATGEDDGLHALGDGELRAECGGCGLEGGDARRDVVTHAVTVEEGHLLLDGAVDAGIAGVEADDEEAAIVEGFHRLELLLERHAGRAAHRGPGLGVLRQFAGHEAAGVEDQVGRLKQAFAAHGDKLRVARPSADDLDEAATLGIGVEGHGQGEVARSAQHALLLLHDEWPEARSPLRGALGNAPNARRVEYLLRGVGHGDVSQFVCPIDVLFSLPSLRQRVEERLVFLQLNGGNGADGERRESVRLHDGGHVFGHALRRTVATATDADVQHARPVIEDGHVGGVDEGRDGDDEPKRLGLDVLKAVEDADVLGQGALQIVRAAILHIEQQGGRLIADEEGDHIIHLCMRGDRAPVETSGQGVERPESGVVALRGDDGLAAGDGGHAPCPVVSPADVTRQDGDDEAPGAVDTEDGRVGVLILNKGGDAADADAHRADKDEEIVLPEVRGHELRIRGEGLAPLEGVGGEHWRIPQLVTDEARRRKSAFRH